MGAMAILVPLCAGIGLAGATMVTHLPSDDTGRRNTGSVIAIDGVVTKVSARTIRNITASPVPLPSPSTTDSAPTVQPVADAAVQPVAAPADANPSGNSKVVSVAVSQIGMREIPLGSNGGPQVYKYTTGRSEAWCADFVSWVYKESGQPFTGGWAHDWQIPAVRDLRIWLMQKGRYQARTSPGAPQPGDVVIFNWVGNPSSYRNNHTGIVERVEGSTLHTIEGNTNNNRVERNVYPNYKTNRHIIGWGSHR